MMKNILIISLISISCSVFAQKENTFSLQQAQEYALKNNYKNQQSLLDIEAAKKRVWETTAIGLPQINAEGAVQKFIDIPTSVAPASSFDPTAPEGALTTFQFGVDYSNYVGISASQLLFDGSYIVGLQAAKTYKDLSINNQAKTEIELRESVAQAYYSVLVAKKNTEIITELLASVQSILKETEALYAEGLLEEQDVDQLKLNENELKTSEGIAEGQIKFAKKLLQLQMGMDVDSTISLADELEVFVDDAKILSTPTAFNVNEHVDFTIVETNVKLMKLNLRKEKYSFLPSANIFFSHQQQNMNTKFDAFSGGQFYPSTLIGASISLPILTSGSRLSKMSQAKIEWQKSKVMQKEVEQGLIYQSQLAQSNLETANETYYNQKENMDLAKKIYDKTTKKYSEGIASSLELSQAQNQYLTAEGDYIRSVLDLLTSKSELQKSYGK